jgi:hypothetical protein
MVVYFVFSGWGRLRQVHGVESEEMSSGLQYFDDSGVVDPIAVLQSTSRDEIP